MIELNKIYNEDCIVGMKRIPDESIDMILCDLPFGTTKEQMGLCYSSWTSLAGVQKDNKA